MAERHWAAWFDHPVPALGGVTPREAARTPLGRERLEALFGEFAARNRHAPPEQRVDLAQLRRELGLEQPATRTLGRRRRLEHARRDTPVS
jgi:hypothetical protein